MDNARALTLLHVPRQAKAHRSLSMDEIKFVMVQLCQARVCVCARMRVVFFADRFPARLTQGRADGSELVVAAYRRR